MASRPPGWWETAYDRLRGKEELGRLQPMPAPTPGMTADQPDPAYTPRKPLNELGARILGIVEDPRNAWIGLGPVGMATKMPKAAKATVKLWDEIGGTSNTIGGQRGSVFDFGDTGFGNSAKVQKGLNYAANEVYNIAKSKDAELRKQYQSYITAGLSKADARARVMNTLGEDITNGPHGNKISEELKKMGMNSGDIYDYGSEAGLHKFFEDFK